MYKWSFFLLVFFFIFNAHTQTFQNFLNRVNAAPDSLKWVIVDSFMNAVPAFPYLEQDTLAHYLFRGNASQVTVPGDANGWNPSAFPMSRISGTDLWYHTHVFESDARLDYKFVLNGNNWILDPLNPYTVVGGFGPNSELRMPVYLPPPEIEYYPNIDHGSLQDTMFYSVNMGNTRQIKVYLPPHYSTTSDSFPIILFHDGLEYLSLASARNVLDYLIWHQRIEPVIGVFVPPVDRTAEYAGNLKTAFSNFIVNEVIPWIDHKYRIRTNPVSRATLGASNGGNIALWLGLNHSEVFANIAAQSSNVQDTISNGYLHGPFLDQKIYLDIGTYDLSVLIPLVDNFQQILQTRGYTYQYQVFHDGHSWGNWRAHIDDALEIFFPGSALNIESREGISENFIIYQNYPNPFNSTTIISLQLREPADISVNIYNIRGQLVRSIEPGFHSTGKLTILWDGRDIDGNVMSTGVYFYRMIINGNITGTRKMLLLR